METHIHLHFLFFSFFSLQKQLYLLQSIEIEKSWNIFYIHTLSHMVNTTWLRPATHLDVCSVVCWLAASPRPGPSSCKCHYYLTVPATVRSECTGFVNIEAHCVCIIGWLRYVTEWVNLYHIPPSSLLLFLRWVLWITTCLIIVNNNVFIYQEYNLVFREF